MDRTIHITKYLVGLFSDRMRGRRDLLNVSGDEDKLPKSSIVTNVDVPMFHNVDIKVRIK